MVFAAMAVGFGLLFALITSAQALSQGNRRWWLWGAIALLAPFLGYAVWRLVGARDDGSPEETLPR